MKPKSTLRSFLLSYALIATSTAFAAPVTWDITPGAVGAGDSAVTGGTGAWIEDLTTGNWTTDGGANNIAWVNANNDTAIFGDTGGAVTIDAAGVTVGGLQFDSAGYTISGGTLTFGAAGSIAANADAAISSAIVGSAAIAKTGTGILTLSGANTSYTGALSLNAGTVRANASADALGGGAATLTLNGGTLALNHSAGLAFNRNTTVAADSTIQSSRDAAGAGLNYTLGTLAIGANKLTAGAGVTTSGTAGLIFGATTLGGNATFEVINGAGSTGQVTLGPVGESGGARNLTKEGGGTLILSDAGTCSGTTTLTAGTLRGTVTGTSLTPGSAFGTSGLSLNAGTLQLRASGTLNTTAETITIGNNTTVGGTTTIDVARPGATSTTKTIQLGTLGIGANTLNVTGANSYALRFGTTTLSGNATFNPTTAGLTLGAVGESGAGRSLTKSGTGSLTLTGAGTYSGGTVISGGTLNISSDGNLGDAAGAVTFSGNSTLNITGTTTSARLITLDPGVTATFTGGGATYSNSGKVTGAGGISCTAGAGTSRSFLFSNTGNDFTGPISLDGNGGGQSNSATFNSIYDDTGAGNISIGSNTLGVSAGASVVFNYGSGANAGLTLNNRRINLLGNGSSSNNTGATFSNQNTTHAVTINTDLLASGANGKLTLDAVAGPTNVFAGVIANGSSTGSGVIICKSGAGTWALSNASNTYTGSTWIKAGSLVINSIANSGVACPIGAADGTTGITLVLNGGTLRYAPINATGAAGHSTNRNIAIVTNSSIDASGTGALVFNAPSGNTISPDSSGVTFTTTSGGRTVTGLSTANLAAGMRFTGTNIPANTTILSVDSATQISISSAATAAGTASDGAFGYPTARTLTLTGTNTDANTIAGNLANSSATGAGTLSLTKSGVGTWAISGTNTYTGSTSISGGTLVIKGATNTNSITFSGGGILGLDIASSVTAASATVDFTGQTVTVIGTPTLASYTLLTVGTMTGGDTEPTLSPAIPGYELDVVGNELRLISAGAPTGYAAWQAANSTGGARDQDHDGDGVDNGTEHFLGGDSNTTGFTALPPVVKALDGTLSVTWTKDVDYTGAYTTDFVVETSATLAGPWTAESVPPTPGANVTITGNDVKYTFPGGPAYSGKNFARLKVTGP